LDEINNSLNRTDDAAAIRQKKVDIIAETKTASVEESRKDILQQVSDGRLSPAEAVQRLKEIQG
jgi:hypothetical protein